MLLKIWFTMQLEWNGLCDALLFDGVKYLGKWPVDQLQWLLNKLQILPIIIQG